MSDAYRDLHDDAYQEWRDESADEFAEIQRRAFKAGFEHAAAESKEFQHLRNWLAEQRDEAHAKNQDRDDELLFARRLAYVDVLTKLSEMGCYPEQSEENP